MTLLVILTPLAYAYLLFAVYILVTGIHRAKLSGRLSGPVLWLCAPMVVIGYVMDCLFNLTLASLVFWERPREWLLTARLQRYITGTGWRARLAAWVCNSLLDPFDPNGNHC